MGTQPSAMARQPFGNGTPDGYATSLLPYHSMCHLPILTALATNSCKLAVDAPKTVPQWCFSIHQAAPRGIRAGVRQWWRTIVRYKAPNKPTKSTRRSRTYYSEQLLFSQPPSSCSLVQQTPEGRASAPVRARHAWQRSESIAC